MNAKQSGHSRQTSAAKAGISRRTAQRIENGTHRPKRGRPRDWKTRKDPLDGHWEADLLPMLEREPRLHPITLFETLQELYPGQYDDKLRTVERRVCRVNYFWASRQLEQMLKSLQIYSDRISV